MATLNGITRDGNNAPLAGATVNVFRVSTNALVGSAVSDASGNYSVTVPDTNPDYYALAFKAGTPFIAGTTRRDLAGVADTVSPDPEVPIGDGTTVKNLWTGVPTSDGVIVSARMNTTKTADKSRLVISRNADLSNPVKSAIVTPDATYRIAKMVATGLLANTEYHYGVEIDGVLDTTTKGRFKTLPAANAAASFRVALGCCANHLVGSAAGFPAWQAVRELSPRPVAFLQIGDIIYANKETTDEASHLDKYESLMSSATGFATRHQTLREIPTAYMHDDHDFGGDNSEGMDAAGAPKAFRAASVAAFRRRVPAPIQSSDPNDTVDYAFTIGRVKFIMSDLRSGKWAIDTGNVGTRTMMGTAQKQRFKDHITAAAAAGHVVVWCSSVTYVDGDWAAFVNDRTELANHIKSAGMSGRVCVISGDMHAQAYHTGVDYATGGGALVPVFNVGAMHSSYSTKGGPYTVGPIAQTATSNYGIMDVTDDGTNINVHWVGKAAADDSVLLEYRFALKGAVVAAAPSRMIAPTATAGEESAEVTLTAPYNGGAGITGYTVTSSPAGGVDAAAGTSALVRTITGLMPGVEYTFTARATNPAGTSVASPASNPVTPVAKVVTVFQATGGTVTEPGDGYKYWTFTEVGSFSLDVQQAGPVEYLVVAGGGGGSAHGTGRGGGGGNGGVRNGSVTIPAGQQTITVGAGGLGVASGSGKGTNGSNSSIAALIEAVGGGAGGYSTFAANPGGSGGGAGAGDSSGAPGQPTAGQGNIGGAGYPESVTTSNRAGGGGGGAGGPGRAATSLKGGDGGPGVTIWGRTLAGGGGGSAIKLSSGGTQGKGQAGGSDGYGETSGSASHALANTGSGGGGSTNTRPSGNGGSGIVIIRRPV